MTSLMLSVAMSRRASGTLFFNHVAMMCMQAFTAWEYPQLVYRVSCPHAHTSMLECYIEARLLGNTCISLARLGHRRRPATTGERRFSESMSLNLACCAANACLLHTACTLYMFVTYSVRILHATRAFGMMCNMRMHVLITKNQEFGQRGVLQPQNLYDGAASPGLVAQEIPGFICRGNAWVTRTRTRACTHAHRSC